MKTMLRLLFLVALSLLAQLDTFAEDADRNYAMWEKEISAYERTDATNPPPKNGIEFIGSSVIARWKTLKQDFPDQPVFDRGFGGSWIEDSTHFANRVIFPYAPRKIFFRAGGNDLWDGRSPEQVFADYQEFTSLVHSNLPNTEIYFIGWNATPSRWKQHEKEQALNGMVKNFVQDKPYLKYIENYDIAFGPDGKLRDELFVADKLHFNAAGYKLLTDRLKPYVAE
jgi:hypothetical protein